MIQYMLLPLDFMYHFRLQIKSYVILVVFFYNLSFQHMLLWVNNSFKYTKAAIILIRLFNFIQQIWYQKFKFNIELEL